MAFVRKKVKTFKWPVKVEEPADGGVFETSTFDAIFKRVPSSAFRDVDDYETLKQVMHGWEGIEDENGKAVPFSVEVLKEFAEDPCWVRGVTSAYIDALAGAKEKN